MWTRRIDAGQVVPDWWGVVRFEPQTLTVLIAPIGLNIAMRAAYAVRVWMIRPWWRLDKALVLEEKLAKANSEIDRLLSERMFR